MHDKKGVKPWMIDVLAERGLERRNLVYEIRLCLPSGQFGEVGWQSIIVDQSCNVGIGIAQEPARVAAYLAIRRGAAFIPLALRQFPGWRETRSFHENANGAR